MRLAPSPRKTLAFLVTISLRGRNPRRSYSSSSDEHLIKKFSDAVKQFSQRPQLSPQIGARPRNPHPFEYNALMKEFGRSGNLEEVLRLFREMKYFYCRPDVVCYSTVIDSLVVWNRPREALAVFAEMIVLGMDPDLACFTILVKLYSCCLKQFALAYDVIGWMVKCGINPDVIAYSTLITGLCWAGRAEEALGVLDWMLEEKCVPNVHTCTPIVQAYCYTGRIESAKSFVVTMERVGCWPNTVTYNVLIEALCKVRAFDEVEKVLGESRMKGWEPDEISYSIYMDGLCKLGMVCKAFIVLEIMTEKGLLPNAVTLNILLDCLCRGSKVWEARCLLERSAELKWDVDVVNYNTVMSRLCDIGMWSAVLKLFTDMLKKGIVANAWTFSILINSLCKAGKHRKAKCIFNSKGFVANVVTYTSIIHQFYVAREMEEVHQLFSKMEEEKVLPNVVTYTIMINCLCQEGKFLEAMKFFHRSLKDGFSPHLVAPIIDALVRSGKIRDTLNLVAQIREWGLTIEFCIFRSLIQAFCGIGCCQSTEIHKVCHILDKMLGVR
nr:pentatricopeptide repeat protein AaPPR733 [Agave angustifolia]UPT49283.1 pentatricopeptide repeat protein AaPPR133 [Agave angustifolia]UPT49375.1 pentatricopeptide repeat protein AaPPR345 [Agave angustifolia]